MKYVISSACTLDDWKVDNETQHIIHGWNSLSPDVGMASSLDSFLKELLSFTGDRLVSISCDKSNGTQLSTGMHSNEIYMWKIPLLNTENKNKTIIGGGYSAPEWLVGNRTVVKICLSLIQQKNSYGTLWKAAYGSGIFFLVFYYSVKMFRKIIRSCGAVAQW